MLTPITKRQLPVYDTTGIQATNTHTSSCVNKVDDLPDFVYQRKGWIRSYQSWSKKRTQQVEKRPVIADGNVFIPSFFKFA